MPCHKTETTRRSSTKPLCRVAKTYRRVTKAYRKTTMARLGLRKACMASVETLAEPGACLLKSIVTLCYRCPIFRGLIETRFFIRIRIRLFFAAKPLQVVIIGLASH